MDIRGHLCDGLKKYQDNGGGCIPNFTKEGFTRGCDDTNCIPILYCPFCGEKLSSIKLYKVKCSDCNEEWETYEEPVYCRECFENTLNIEIVEL